MNGLKIKQIGLICIVLAMIGSLSMSFAQAAELPQVHVLMVFDTDAPNQGEMLRAEQHRFQALFQSYAKGNTTSRLNYNVLTGADATPERIYKFFAELTVNPNDTILTYIHAPGQLATKNGHVFALTHGHLGRAYVRAFMRSKQPRLSVLLSDIRELAAGGNVLAANDQLRQAFASDVRANRETMDRLFFAGEGGLVEANACRPGQSLPGATAAGGYFGQALIEAFGEKPNQIAPQGGLNWKLMLGHTQSLVASHFGDGGEQEVEVSNLHRWPQQFIGKNLVVKNLTGGNVVVHVRYQTFNGGPWLELSRSISLSANATYAVVDPQAAGAPLIAKSFQAWADSTDGKGHWDRYKDEPIKTGVGQFGYSDDMPHEFVLTFHPQKIAAAVADKTAKLADAK